MKTRPITRQSPLLSSSNKQEQNTQEISVDKEYLDKQFRNLSREILRSEENFNRKLNKLDDKLDRFEGNIFELAQKQDDLKQEQSTLKNTVKELKEKISLLETQQKRDNLRFYGVQERANETPTSAVTRFLREVLGLGNMTEKMVILRASRIGPPKDNQPRTIVAKFLHQQDIITVKQAAQKKPKGVKGGVSDDLPTELLVQKSALQKAAREARQKGKDVKWSRGKLLINGAEVKVSPSQS